MAPGLVSEQFVVSTNDPLHSLLFLPTLEFEGYFYFLDLVVSLCAPLFMQHTRVQFIEERHTGGKLLQMCISLAAVQS